MGRRKIEIKAIKDDRNRSVTFLKRKGGLFKKAHELAVLCSVDVAVIIFGHNKKLYEFSSCDMRETLGRYQYYGPPHEHKGPEDFTGKRDDDDDEDETTPAPEEMQPTSQTHPPMIPTHIPGHPGFQHVNHAPSASPPISNGISFDPRHGTPQPQGNSRPSSRNHLRRVSSNLGPPQHHGTPPPPPPPQNGFAYIPNPSMYHPNANPNMAQQPRSAQFAHYAHAPPGPHQSLPHGLPTHTMPPQTVPPHHQAPQHIPQHPHPLAQQTAAMGMSQPPHPSIPQVAQTFLPEQGRNSMPPAFPSEQQQPPRPVSLPDATSADQIVGSLKVETSPSPPHQRSLSSKSRSIFTPIDDRGSVLARHFGLGPPLCDSPRNDGSDAKGDSKSEDTKDIKVPNMPLPPRRAPMEVLRSHSAPDIKPPPRTNSGPLSSKRPQLKVQIPSENSDRGSATADSSRDSAENKTITPAKANPDTNHSGVVLPPPSPSAGAILSAGAQGPPNPFARPPPPGTTTQNNTAYNSNNNIETPISALPSRFVSDALLPSPSSFFPEWGFGRSGPDTNMLPSPLTFPTPAVQSGPGFSREDEHDKKRKSPDSGPSSEGTAKKAKT